ncbi:MAG TPA: O-antigen ligase domain-containing protein, partial [Bacteroidetes bacterium]|nr:O-antigen ligase domain-containing protein [Bacteroidota bacterium]
LALCLADLSRTILVKYLFVSVAAVFAFNILICGSRNGLLGLVSVGGLGIIFMKRISRPVRIGVLALLVVSIVGFGIANVLSRSDIQGSGLTGDASSESRIVQWKACIRMTLHHPLLGVGPNESRFNMVDFGGVRGLMPHNTLVQVFAETGMPGGLFFVMCTIYPLWEAYKFFKINRDKMADPSVVLYKYLIIALVSFWVCAFFSNRVYFKILYVLVALIVALRENILTKQQELIPTCERERPSVLSNKSSLQSN